MQLGTKTNAAVEINPTQFVEAARRRTASRAEIRALLADYLRRDRSAVENFGAAGFGIDRVRIGDPELILLDLEHPDRSGPEVLQGIQSDPDTRVLPVVMLSGAATAVEKVRAPSAEVTDFMTEPFAPQSLVQRIRALVALKPSADEHEDVERVILTLARAIAARGPHRASAASGSWSAAAASRFE